MKTLKLSITAIILVFSLVTNVQAAEVSMADYRRLKDDKPFDLFFGGYLSGMTAGNTVLAARNRPLLFCPPPKLVLNASNLKQILDRYWEQKPSHDETAPFGLVALEALQDAFPCK